MQGDWHINLDFVSWSAPGAGKAIPGTAFATWFSSSALYFAVTAGISCSMIGPEGKAYEINRYRPER